MKGMKVIKNTTIYKCKYCSKIYVRNFYAEKHHFRCKKNPDNSSPCYLCNHLTQKEFEILNSSPYGENYQTHKSFYCEKKSVFLKPRWASFIENLYYEDEPEIKKMPRKCKIKDA